MGSGLKVQPPRLVRSAFSFGAGWVFPKKKVEHAALEVTFGHFLGMMTMPWLEASLEVADVSRL
jgi:hypothetical protein